MFNYQSDVKAFRGKCAKPRPIYSQIECLDCELIISVKWERKYTGALETRQHQLKKKPCPFCKGTHIIYAKIKNQDYIDINKHWDILDMTESDNIF